MWEIVRDVLAVIGASVVLCFALLAVVVLGFRRLDKASRRVK